MGLIGKVHSNSNGQQPAAQSSSSAGKQITDTEQQFKVILKGALAGLQDEDRRNAYV